MVTNILEKIIPNKKETFRYTLTALCKENVFIELMENMPQDVEFSSLPKLYSDGWRVTISIASDNNALAKESFDKYIHLLETKKIVYALNDGE